MAKFEEREVLLGDAKYNPPRVTVRRIDLTFGKVSLQDPRIRPYLTLDPPVLRHQADEHVDMIIHCVTHDVLIDGVTWGSSEAKAARPDNWCQKCQHLRSDHAPIEAELKQADQAKRDAHTAQYPVARRWNESEVDYAGRLAHAKVMVRKAYPQDIEVAIDQLTASPTATGIEVLAAMIDARYSVPDRDMVDAIVARRVRLNRKRSRDQQ